jgi:hypothetical protein
MGISVINPAPVSGGKTRKVATLNSGSSWTVPAGINYVNATLIGGGGGCGRSWNVAYISNQGGSGQIVQSTVNTTPGANINYSIGGGGNSASDSGGSRGGTGGTTTFTGASSALGGKGGSNIEQSAVTQSNGVDGMINGYGQGGFPGTDVTVSNSNGMGGAGQIILEYWE